MLFLAQEDRRDRGVRLGSKGTVIPGRCVCRNQFPKCRSQRAGLAHNLLRELRQMMRSLRQEGEHVPDLRILGPGRSHGLDCIGIGGGLRVVLYAR